LTVTSRHQLWVRAYVPQRFLQLRLGQKLRVTVDSIAGQEFQGEVSFIASQAEFTPSNVQTSDDRAALSDRVSISDNREELRPGMTANVWLPTTDSGT
jgi:multidrug efflux pump subunit AcrA (membrane-fusion protein)